MEVPLATDPSKDEEGGGDGWRARSPRRRRRRSRKSSRRSPRIWITGGLALLALVVAGVPLALGGVHRLVTIPAFLLTLTALACVAGGEWSAGVPLRMSAAASAPLLVFLAIPLLQSVPLPSFIVDRLDPAAAELQLDALPRRFRALSLDPPATWLAFAQAAAALATVVVTAHVMSGRSLRYLLLRAIVLSGIAAVVIGVGHRILGEEHIYGVFNGSRGVLNGPFINPNNTAEFLELGAFAAVALAFVKSTVINRIGWLAAAGFLAAGALATLSRGGILGIGIAGALFVALYRRAGQGEGDPPSRPSWFFFALTGGLVVLVALSLGASQLLAKFAQSGFSQETRFRLWRDSLKLLFAHPLGIGRGAFDRLYPTVRSVEVAISVRFAWAENEPLQMLLDTGWFGMAAIVAAILVLVRQVYRQRRGDRIELALVCGLIAVLVHNLVDFGLETLGVLLPFAVLLGALLGRTKNWGDLRLPRARGLAVAGMAGLGLLLGSVAVALPSGDNFDVRIRTADSNAQRRVEILRAQAAHPFDYYYVLLQARTEPLVKANDTHSPRLRVLNRALALCPRCPEVHTEVGRSLWALGKRRQALVEWRTALTTRPVLFGPITEEAWSAGAKPEEMALLAGDNPAMLIRIAELLHQKSDRVGTRKVLNTLPVGFPTSREVLLLNADLDLEDGLTEEATKDLDRVDAITPNDPRACLLRAELALRAKDVAGALAILDKGIGATPNDVPLQDRRVQVVMSAQKWSRAKDALEGLEMAMFHAGISTTSVHTARAQVAEHLGDSKTAISEYRAAINQGDGEARLWIDLARYYETLGRYADAQMAWREAQHKLPNEPTIADAIARLHERQAAEVEGFNNNRLLLGR